MTKYPATEENLSALIARATETDSMCERYATTHPDKVKKWAASARRDRREIARISEILGVTQ
jgi:hypothetical protein